MTEENSIKELEERHHREVRQFVTDCPHTDVAIEDGNWGNEREIILRCKRCQLNLLGFTVGRSYSYLSYVRDCVNGHPDSRKYGCTATNKKNIFDAMDAAKKTKKVKK